MTKAQTSLYFRWWGRARAALESGRTRTDVGAKVEEMGSHLEGRGAADALRHACHVIALGRQKSSKTFTNAELDRVLLVFRLIVNGDDLAARIAWEQPEQGQAKRLTWSIKHTAPEALIVHVAKDKFGKGDWWNLGVTELRQLLMTLKRIRDRKDEKDLSRELVEEPF